MVEVLGTGDNGVENNAIQEARSFLGTLVAGLEDVGLYIMRWFYRALWTLVTWMEARPEYAIMMVVNLLILFA